MPKGKFKQKGKSRHFTNQDELERQHREDELAQSKANGQNPEDSESGEDGSDEEEVKHKGIDHLIEVSNPNRQPTKLKKLAAIDGETDEAPELSRRQREEIAAHEAKVKYEKAHAAGQTEQARMDLARLALVRKEREEAARQAADEKRLKEEEAAKRAADREAQANKPGPRRGAKKKGKSR